MENEIVSLMQYRAKCIEPACEFLTDCDTPYEAEKLARHHINDDIGDINPRPYADHTVEIFAVRRIGRYL